MGWAARAAIIGLGFLALAAAGCEEPVQWSVGCTAGVCAAVNSNGDVRYFDLSSKQATGTGKLPSDPVAPVHIDCNSQGTTEACAVVDAVGHVWFGPAKPGNPFAPADFNVSN